MPEDALVAVTAWRYPAWRPLPAVSPVSPLIAVVVWHGEGLYVTWPGAGFAVHEAIGWRQPTPEELAAYQLSQLAQEGM
jgi:hypothetical protein